MNLPFKHSPAKIALILWMVFSVCYVAYDIYSNIRYNLLQSAYQGGRADTVNELLAKAKECKPFNVFSGENKADLINIECLKQAPATGSGAQK